MTTMTQIKKVIKPILEKHNDLAFQGGIVVLKPVHHLVRGIILDRTSDATRFSLRWGVIHSFRSSPVFSTGFGAELFPRMRWSWNNPNLSNDLIRALETEALPRLRNIQSLNDYVELARQNILHGWDQQYLRKMPVDIAMGDFDAARTICRDVISRYTPETFPGDAEDKAHFADLKKLCAMLASDDRKGMAAMLHAFEAETVKNLKLEQLWQPTPFPFELEAK